MSRPARKGDDRGELPIGASATERPALRRGLLGYRREDVHLALDARDAEVAELRQDVAALWLAFGQHDRMIRAALEQGAATRSAAPPAPPDVPRTADPAPAAPVANRDSGGSDASPAAISRQLAELDEVLAAIETATQSLERSYAGEIAPAQEAEEPAGDPEDASPPRTESG